MQNTPVKASVVQKGFPWLGLLAFAGLTGLVLLTAWQKKERRRG